MRNLFMKKIILWCIILALFPVLSLFPETKTALVIGNAGYGSITRLKNPVHDARDVAGELKKLGFEVILKTDANLAEMEEGVVELQQRLRRDPDSTGLFFYAGHGVQAEGINYLIPVDAAIQSSSQLRYRATSVDFVLDSMNEAGNSLNMVILDACRDNPFPWSRGGSRGLAVAARQPPGSIIMYATGAGDVASDGSGRNGLFTEKLLASLRTPGLDVQEVFRRTGEAVQRASGGNQNPAIYSQFFGRYTFRPGSAPASSGGSAPASTTAGLSGPVGRTPSFSVQKAYGKVSFTTVTAGSLYMNGKKMGELPSGGTALLEDLETGSYSFEMRYENGEKEIKTLQVEKDRTVKVGFAFSPRKEYGIGDTGPAGGIVYYDKGSYSNGWRYLEAAPAETEWKNKQWGGRGTSVGGTSIAGIGTGSANTEAIVAEYGALEPYKRRPDYAAQLCYNLNYGGYDDWFLPSEDELTLMYKNLYVKELGGFVAYWYWSSSEIDSESAWTLNFNNGRWNRDYKYHEKSDGHVRASRAF